MGTGVIVEKLSIMIWFVCDFMLKLIICIFGHWLTSQLDTSNKPPVDTPVKQPPTVLTAARSRLSYQSESRLKAVQENEIKNLSHTWSNVCVMDFFSTATLAEKRVLILKWEVAQA